ARGGAGQCLGGDDQSRSDGTTQEIALSRDDIEGGGRAEGDNDGRAAIEVMRGQRCDDTIGAKLPWVIDEQFHAQVECVIEEDGFFIAIAAREFLEDWCQWGHNT